LAGQERRPELALELELELEQPWEFLLAAQRASQLLHPVVVRIHKVRVEWRFAVQDLSTMEQAMA
jgi:hypothetical protein